MSPCRTPFPRPRQIHTLWSQQHLRSHVSLLQQTLLNMAEASSEPAKEV